MRPYKAPNKRMIARRSDGRFTVPSLGCAVCPSCGSIHPPEQVNVGSEAFPLMKTVTPDKCRECGADMPKP